MAFNESLHPRVPAGSAGGGEFGKSGKAPAKKSAAGTIKKAAPPFKGSLSYDAKSNRGAGYGSKGGDANVRTLQHKLNRLGITDASGKPLVLDGKLGPKTTAAIKAAQRRLGLKPDGIVTAALFQKILGMKGSAPQVQAPAAKAKAAPAHHAPARHSAPHKAAAKPKAKPKTTSKPKTARSIMHATPLVRQAF